jgi:hypothetical protein
MKLTPNQLRRIIKEEVEMTRLRRVVRRQVRNLFEASDTPEIVAKDGKIQVTCKGQMFDFSPDEVKKLVKPGSVYSDDYDQDSEDGCMMSMDTKGGPIKVTVHKGGSSIFTDELDKEELKSAMEQA